MTHRSLFASSVLVLALALPVAASAQHGGPIDVPDVPSNLTVEAGNVPLQREALLVRQRIFGPSNPESAFAVLPLAGTLEMQGRNREAEALLSDAYSIVLSAIGADHPRVVNMAVDLSRVRIARGDAAGVEAMLRRALEMRQQTYTAGHWRIAEAQALLGASLAAQHRNEEAEALMRAADRSLQPIPGRQAREREANRVRLRRITRG